MLPLDARSGLGWLVLVLRLLSGAWCRMLLSGLMLLVPRSSTGFGVLLLPRPCASFLHLCPTSTLAEVTQ